MNSSRHRPDETYYPGMGFFYSVVRHLMAMLIWQAPMRYFSAGDEAAFFSWLQSISGVVSVRGYGHELHIRLRSKRLSVQSLRELLALYQRYQGNMNELAQFANQANSSWFADTNSYWYSQVFGSTHAA